MFFLILTVLWLAACHTNNGTSVEAQRDELSSEATGSPETSCPRPGHRAFTGVVERRGAGYTLRSGERSIDLWAISQQEMVAPHSPDLSGQVGREVTVCGQFDGTALYEAELRSSP